jgi:hypothetical protein
MEDYLHLKSFSLWCHFPAVVKIVSSYNETHSLSMISRVAVKLPKFADNFYKLFALSFSEIKITHIHDQGKVMTIFRSPVSN